MVAKANCIRWRLVIAVAVGAALVAALIDQGQAAATAATDASVPHIKSMAISVLPEYDQPRVLVSYQGELEGVSGPLALSVRIPADAHVRHVCSLAPPDNGHICQPYTFRLDGDWMIVEYEVPHPAFYLEYDYGSVSGDGTRSLDFTFWAPLPVDALQLWVQEPLGATDFTLSPDATDLVDGGGYRHHGYALENVSLDDPVALQMSYSREVVQPAAAVGAAENASDSDGGDRWLVFLLGLLAAAALAVGTYIGLARVRRAEEPAEVGSGGWPPERGGGRSSVCEHCGHALGVGFRYCPGCGRPAGVSSGNDVE